MRLVNFSIDGYCLRSHIYLGKGIAVNMEFLAPFPSTKLPALFPVETTVLWSAPKASSEFDLGVKITSLNENAKLLVYNSIMSLYLKTENDQSIKTFS